MHVVKASKEQDSSEAQFIRTKELINVGGVAWVFSAGTEVNGRVVLPDASKDTLGLQNAHIYRHDALGDFVAFAVDYQSLGGDSLVRQGWELHPYLRADHAHLHVTLEGNIVRFDEDDSDDESDDDDAADSPAATVVGKRVELELVGPAPVCFRCENVHAEGAEVAHEQRQAHIKGKLDGMLGQGWDEDLSDDDEDEEEDGAVTESADAKRGSRASSLSCPHCDATFRANSAESDRHQLVAEYQIMTMPRDRTPNWDAGRAHIDGLERTPLPAWPNSSSFTARSEDALRDSGVASSQAFWADRLRTALSQVEHAWSRRSLHFNRIDEVRDADILVAGGYLTECIVEKSGTGAMAWVNMLEASGVSRTVGFDD
jgi:hypothetical protein